MKNGLFIPSRLCTDDENGLIADHLNFNKRHGMEGMVAVLHKRKDGFREILPPTHNHIVMTGRRWVMQACMNKHFKDSGDNQVKQKDWTLNWFGVGNGGANAATPNIPLDTGDSTTSLGHIIDIRPTSITADTEGNYLYTVADNSHRKRIKCETTGTHKTIVDMNYNTSTSEVMMVLNLELDYDDCPYGDTDISVGINELGLYASPDVSVTETQCVLFSRYCRPTIYKTSGDSYVFIWYIYF